MAFIFPLIGAVVSAAATIAGGNAAKQAAEGQNQAMIFRAKQEEKAAMESRAASQRAALDKRREEGIVESRLIATAAASGGGATDPTVIALGENIAGRGEYEALTETYKGENRARGYEDQASADKFQGQLALMEGKAKQSASRLSALGTIISGAGSAYATFNKTPIYGMNNNSGYG